MAPGLIASARHLLASTLELGLPDVDVLAFPRAGDPPNARRVVLAPVRVNPVSVACPWRTVTIDLWCVSPYTDPGPADDDVDDLTDDVLAVLDAHGIDWTGADRAVWNDTHPAYRVTTEVRTA